MVVHHSGVDLLPRLIDNNSGRRDIETMQHMVLVDPQVETPKGVAASLMKKSHNDLEHRTIVKLGKAVQEFGFCPVQKETNK